MFGCQPVVYGKNDCICFICNSFTGIFYHLHASRNKSSAVNEYEARSVFLFSGLLITFNWNIPFFSFCWNKQIFRQDLRVHIAVDPPHFFSKHTHRYSVILIPVRFPDHRKHGVRIVHDILRIVLRVLPDILLICMSNQRFSFIQISFFSIRTDFI